MISGSASSCRDFTWMKWMSRPSISVVNCGSAFSLASHLRQSYSCRPSSARAPASSPTARPASDRRRAPRWASVSRAMRRREVVQSSRPRISTWKGRMSTPVLTVVLIRPPSVGRVRGRHEVSPSRLPAAPVEATGRLPGCSLVCLSPCTSFRWKPNTSARGKVATNPPMHSAIRSATASVETFVFVRGMVGMIEASATNSPSIP